MQEKYVFNENEFRELWGRNFVPLVLSARSANAKNSHDYLLGILPRAGRAIKVFYLAYDVLKKLLLKGGSFFKRVSGINNKDMQ
jgi:hypothetical protein